MTFEDESVQRIIVERLECYGFYESKKKPGLFFKQTNSAKLFVDMRTNRTRFYGYTDPENEEISEENNSHLWIRHFSGMNKELASIGVVRLEEFQEHDTEVCPCCGQQIKRR